MIADISQEEMNALTQSILTRYGIDFTCYEPKSLRRRIIRVLGVFNLSSIHELWVRFLHDRNFIHLFMNEVSVGMTSMFRDPILWRNLRKRVITEYDARNSIRCWHAGCSTGEEVYSFGILLQETSMQEKTKVLATDINQNALEEAKRGVYHKIKMIENEVNYRELNFSVDFSTYYLTDSNYAIMQPQLIKHATFYYHNLITDSFPKGMDIIFCRNVMIYLDGIAKTRLLQKFYDALNPGGYLIIGFFDTVNYFIDNKMFYLVDGAAKIFKRY
jgi:chemotaxis protein methyltransferase CheR